MTKDSGQQTLSETSVLQESSKEIIEPQKAINEYEKLQLSEGKEVMPEKGEQVNYGEKSWEEMDKMKMSFFETLSKEAEPLIKIIKKSWKTAFDPEKDEVNDPFYNQVKDKIGDFFRFTSLVGKEIFDWVYKWKDEHKVQNTKIGLESYYQMEKIAPKVADESIFFVQKKYAENEPEPIQKSLEEATKAALLTYHDYESEKEGKAKQRTVINDFKEIIGLMEDSKDLILSKEQIAVVKRVIDYGIDFLYKLKDLYGKERAKEILNFLNDYFGKKDSTQNILLLKLKPIFKLNGMKQIGGIISDYITAEDNKTAEKKEGNVLSKMDDFLEKKYAKTENVLRLVSVYKNIKDPKNIGINDLMEIIEVLSREDLKEILGLYYKSLNQ